MLKVILSLALMCILSLGPLAQSADTKQISSAELANWTLLGDGSAMQVGAQVQLQESQNSKGIMLLSPAPYGPNTIVKYRVMALTPATVLVTMLSVSDPGAEGSLTVPDEYNGSIGLWSNEKENYFFAFKNAPHDRTPFLRKQPNSKEFLAIAAQNHMVAGQYYAVVVAQEGSRLWLSIDGQMIWEAQDLEAYGGGHVAIRLRGVVGYPAACMIKGLEIVTK